LPFFGSCWDALRGLPVVAGDDAAELFRAANCPIGLWPEARVEHVVVDAFALVGGVENCSAGSGALLLHISGNDSTGRFSREWVAVDAIRKALAKAPKGAGAFKAAVLLRAAWEGQSSCNGGFGAAALVAESVLEKDARKRGMQRLASPKALDDWEKRMLDAEVPKDAGEVPLHAPKAAPFSAKTREKDG